MIKKLHVVLLSLWLAPFDYLAAQPATQVPTSDVKRGASPPSITPETFGASPNNSGDSGPAFNAAIAAASGGAIIYCSGNYRIGTTITVNKRLSILGSGYSEDAGNGAPCTLRKAKTLKGDLIHVTQAAVHISNLNLEGESGNGGDGLHISTNYVSIDRVSIFHQGGWGLTIGNGNGTGNMNFIDLHRLMLGSNDGGGWRVDYGGNTTSTNTNAGTAVDIDTEVSLRGEPSCRVRIGAEDGCFE